MSYKRKSKLALPGFQYQMIARLIGISAIGITLEFMLVFGQLQSALNRAQAGEQELAEALGQGLMTALLLSLGLVLPFVAILGVELSFRIAGPIYAVNRYLRGVASGEQSKPFKLRDGDQFQFLRESVNDAVSSLKHETPAEVGDRIAA